MTTVTGTALTAVFIIFAIVSLPRFRKKHFRLFQVNHEIGALVTFALLIPHGVHQGKPNTYK